jgi:tetratricopeptide (TPR) repeat protein
MRLLLLAVFTMAVSGCFSVPVEPDRQAEMQQALGDMGDQSGISAEDGAGGNPNDTSRPGMIHIKRFTDEYTISMVLDASEENIFFVMDLPAADQIETVPALKPGEKPKQDKKEEPAATPTEQEQNKPVASSENQAGKHIVYAQTYFFEKKYGRALDEVNRALEFTPNSALAHSLKGTIHYKKGERDAAKSAWQRALELDPGMDNVKTMLEQLK